MRNLVSKTDGPDPRDRRYVPSTIGLLSAAPPAIVDMRSRLPNAWNQGGDGSCGAQSASALVCALNDVRTPYSRLQIYYCVRQIENSIRTDTGVETRNLFRVLNKIGAAPEHLWSYHPAKMYAAPPAPVLAAAKLNRISSYSRLIGEDDMISCLAEGFPFVMGFQCFESFESNDLARTGVMRFPDSRREKRIGGHDVLVVGYDLKFRSSPAFRNSRVDPALVSDHALLVRNSWGTEWGVQGHFWMPMSYAVNPSTGGDSWTGRL